MKVSGFMVPAAKVVSCTEDDLIQRVVADMTAHKISCIVVLDKANPKKAVGIVTKTDLIQAYGKQVPLTGNVGSIMTPYVKTVPSSTQRDEVAKVFEGLKFHHAVVVDDATGDCVGLVSAWDVATECAKDARAWPYVRTEDGKIHP